jgi:hypothetical protein
MKYRHFDTGSSQLRGHRTLTRAFAMGALQRQAGHRPEDVPAHPLSRVSHATKRRGDSVVTQWTLLGTGRRENVTASPSERLDLPQNGSRLA